MLGCDPPARGPHGGVALSPALPTATPAPAAASRDAAAGGGAALPPRCLRYVLGGAFLISSPCVASSRVRAAMPGRILAWLALSRRDRRGGAAGRGVRAKFPLRMSGAKDGSSFSLNGAVLS